MLYLQKYNIWFICTCNQNKKCFSKILPDQAKKKETRYLINPQSEIIFLLWKEKKKEVLLASNICTNSM